MSREDGGEHEAAEALQYGRSAYPPMGTAPYLGYDPSNPGAVYGLPPPPPMDMVASLRRAGSTSPQLLHHEGISQSPWASLNKRQSRRVSQMPPHSALSKREAPLYEDLINFPRAKDKDEMRCVMCGMPPGGVVVIPRQNKDVCKDCDKSTWHHTATGVYFKWCKGCKKFLKLGSFSQKLDAAKCDKCRERGRQSYLMKKGREGEDVSVRNPTHHYTAPPYTGPMLPPQQPPPMSGSSVSRQSLMHRRARPKNFHHAIGDGSDYSGDEGAGEDRRHHAHHHLDPALQMHMNMLHGAMHPGMLHPPHLHMGQPGEEEDVDEAAADQALTQMRLSTNFGVPYQHMQQGEGIPGAMGITTTPPNGPVSSYNPGEPNGGGAAASQTTATAGGSGVVVTDHDNLRKLARIQEEVRQLEAQAAQVMVISNKLSEESTTRRQADARVQALERENQHLRSEIDRLGQELSAWQAHTQHTDEGYDGESALYGAPAGGERSEAISTYDPSGAGGEKRNRSDSINGAAALLGGIKKQRVGHEEGEGKLGPVGPMASAMMPFPQSTYEGPGMELQAQQQQEGAAYGQPQGEEGEGQGQPLEEGAGPLEHVEEGQGELDDQPGVEPGDDEGV